MGDSPDDPDRDAILRRRRRLIGVALAGLASAGLGACSPCLSFIVDGGPDAGSDAGSDAGPQACLSRPPDDAGLDDAGLDAGFDDAGLDGGAPMPCLSPPLDAGEEEA